MKISITGKQIDIGTSLRSYVEEHADNTVKRFFDSPLNASVAFSKEGNLIKVDMTVHPISGVLVQGSSSNADAYAAFDAANDRIGKQLLRYKKRLTDHKAKAERSTLRLSSLKRMPMKKRCRKMNRLLLLLLKCRPNCRCARSAVPSCAWIWRMFRL